MPEDRIQKCWMIMFDRIGSVAVNNVDRDQLKQAINQAITEMKKNHPEVSESMIVHCAYSEIHLPPVLSDNNQKKRDSKSI